MQVSVAVSVGEEELRFLIKRVFFQKCLPQTYVMWKMGYEAVRLGLAEPVSNNGGGELSKLGNKLLEKAVELGLLRKRRINLYGSGLTRTFYCRTKKCEEAR